MRHLRIVAVHGQPVEAGGHGALCDWDQLDFSAAIWDLLKTLPGAPNNDSEQTRSMEKPGSALERQLRQINAMAMQHFPNDEAARNAYKVELLEARLREYAFRVEVLPVKEMK
jgi:hypothetical protein